MPIAVHIVDDEPSVRKAVARLLRAAGYDVAVYESAERLLDQLPENQEPGCILLDILMPGVNGLAVQERLKEGDWLSASDCVHDWQHRADRWRHRGLPGKASLKGKTARCNRARIGVRLPRRIVPQWGNRGTPSHRLS